MDPDSFVLSISSNDFVKNLQNLNGLFPFSNPNSNHERFSSKNIKVLGKFKTATSKKIWIDEFICFRNQAYSFKCNEKNTNKMKSFSKSQVKNIKFNEFYNCLLVGECQTKRDKYVIRSINQGKYLQKVTKISLSVLMQIEIFWILWRAIPGNGFCIVNWLGK